MVALTFKPCIIIPVYNHGNELGSVIQSLQSFSLAIFLVNDGSDVACVKTLERLAKTYQLTLLHLPVNQGKGAAFKHGLQEAFCQGYSHAMQIDADGQHDTGDIETFLTASQADPLALICGCPVYDRSVPMARYVSRYLTHVWVWINTLSLEIRDSMCGFRVYPVTASITLLSRHYTGNRMEFDVEFPVLWHWSGKKIINLPTQVIYPDDGVSHFKLLQDNVLISTTHARLFFGMVIRFPKLLLQKKKRTT